MKYKYKEIKKLLEKLGVRKATVQDDVNRWILKERREQIEELIWNIINSLLKEGKG